MKFAVNQLDFEINQRISRDRPTRGRVLDSLLNRRSPILRNRAAENLIHELESSAARQTFEDTRSFGELAPAPGLFFMPPNNLGPALKGFQVSDLRRMKLDFNTVSSFQLVHRHFDVSL